MYYIATAILPGSSIVLFLKTWAFAPEHLVHAHTHMLLVTMSPSSFLMFHHLGLVNGFRGHEPSVGVCTHWIIHVCCYPNSEEGAIISEAVL